jgi:hypothetical protein
MANGKGAAPIKLVVADWEGCIVGTSPRLAAWPLAQMDRLRERLRASGVLFSICTGRQLAYLEAAIQALGVYTRAVSVAEGGSVSLDPTSGDHGVHPLVTPYVRHLMQELRATLEPEVRALGASLEPGKEICISVRPAAGMSPATVRDALSATLRGLPLCTSCSGSAFDIVPTGLDKGAGLRSIAEGAGVPLSETLAIGDSEGDLPMLKLAGHAACPANGREAVGSAVEYAARSQNAEGVLEILQHYGL